MSTFTPASPAAVGDRLDGELVAVEGVVAAVTPRITAQQNPWASAVIDGLECLVYPATYREFAPLVVVGAELTVAGRVDLREPQPRLVAMEITASVKAVS
ncbi:hypothetical protein [Streptomyces sp. MZ04]|uniref:hypothetical protein n=1 Tax=Streptomyces sp. MZ04 TaxID=2559236 RepID=UPI00107EDBC8|nr:hypothetical protein [Streptomyces sp. MZ04]TGB06541.1 hypothetical protein E2651_23295 [Streptomyces sp. MZ04]